MNKDIEVFVKVEGIEILRVRGDISYRADPYVDRFEGEIREAARKLLRFIGEEKQLEAA